MLRYSTKEEKRSRMEQAAKELEKRLHDLTESKMKEEREALAAFNHQLKLIQLRINGVFLAFVAVVLLVAFSMRFWIM